MLFRSGKEIAGFYEYVVPPLEGLWQQSGTEDGSLDYSRKQDLEWISMIRLPDFITEADVQWAIAEVQRKKQLDCSAVEFFTYDEGLCVQVMHIGSYDDEPATVEKMHKYIKAQGYELDISDNRLHHEIYLSDARKVVPEKLNTVIRHPVRKI